MFQARDYLFSLPVPDNELKGNCIPEPVFCHYSDVFTKWQTSSLVDYLTSTGGVRDKRFRKILPDLTLYHLELRDFPFKHISWRSFVSLVVHIYDVFKSIGHPNDLWPLIVIDRPLHTHVRTNYVYLRAFLWELNWHFSEVGTQFHLIKYNCISVCKVLWKYVCIPLNCKPVTVSFVNRRAIDAEENSCSVCFV